MCGRSAILAALVVVTGCSSVTMPHLVVGPFDTEREETMTRVRALVRARHMRVVEVDGTETIAVPIDLPARRPPVRQPTVWLQLDDAGYLRILPRGTRVHDDGENVRLHRAYYQPTRDLALALVHLRGATPSASSAPPPPGVLNPRVERSADAGLLSAGGVLLGAAGLLGAFAGYVAANEGYGLILYILPPVSALVGTILCGVGAARPVEHLVPGADVRLVPAAPGAQVGASVVARF